MLLRLQCVETHPAELKPGKHNRTQEVEQECHQRHKDEFHVHKIQILDRVCGSCVTLRHRRNCEALKTFLAPSSVSTGRDVT